MIHGELSFSNSQSKVEVYTRISKQCLQRGSKTNKNRTMEQCGLRFIQLIKNHVLIMLKKHSPYEIMFDTT